MRVGWLHEITETAVSLNLSRSVCGEIWAEVSVLEALICTTSIILSMRRISSFCFKKLLKDKWIQVFVGLIQCEASCANHNTVEE